MLGLVQLHEHCWRDKKYYKYAQSSLMTLLHCPYLRGEGWRLVSFGPQWMSFKYTDWDFKRAAEVSVTIMNGHTLSSVPPTTATATDYCIICNTVLNVTSQLIPSKFLIPPVLVNISGPFSALRVPPSWSFSIGFSGATFLLSPNNSLSQTS